MAQPPTPNVVGNSFYVASNGNDVNPGTLAQPWRTIQKAANTMVAGDSVTVLPSTYNEHVQVTRSGAPGAPITFQASGTVTMQGFTVRADYIAIRDFDITNTPDNSIDGWAIYIVTGNFCTLDENYIHYATRGGITIGENTNQCIVKNNRLYRNALVGIEVYGTGHLIEANEIWGTIQYHPGWSNPPDWVDADGIHFHGSGHIFRKNYIHDITYKDPENVTPHIDCFQTFQGAGKEAGHDILFEQNRCTCTGKALC